MKTVKTIVATALAGVMLFSMAGCSVKKIEPVSSSKFNSACSEYDVELDEYAEEGYENLYFYNQYYYIDYFSYTDADAAEDLYEDAYGSFDHAKSGNDFSGTSRFVSMDDFKYMLFNGNSDTDGLFEPLSDFYESLGGELDGYVYGGIFWADDMIIVCVTTSSDKEDKDLINNILSEIGYPHP